MLTQLFENFNKIRKDPKTFTIIIIASLLLSTSVILFKIVNRNDENSESRLADCNKRNDDLSDELKEIRRENSTLIKAMLVKNGVINKLTSELDSSTVNN